MLLLLINLLLCFLFFCFVPCLLCLSFGHFFFLVSYHLSIFHLWPLRWTMTVTGVHEINSLWNTGQLLGIWAFSFFLFSTSPAAKNFLRACVLSHVRLWNLIDGSQPGSSVHGNFQARVLEWIAVPTPGDIPNPGIEPHSLRQQVDSLPLRHLGRYLILVRDYTGFAWVCFAFIWPFPN